MLSITNKARSKIYYTFGILFILLGWLVTSYIIDNEIILPRITSVIKALGQMLIKVNTYKVILMSLFRLLIAVLGSFILSLTFAILSTLFKRFSDFITPIISLLKTIPVASIIIILLVIIGHETSSIYITSLVILPIMYESFLNGMKTIDKTIIEEVKLFSNINFQVIKAIHIPLMMQTIITGVIQSVGLGLKVMVMAEFISQPKDSIGKAILYEKQYLEISKVFAWTIILIVLILIIDLILNVLRKKQY